MPAYLNEKTNKWYCSFYYTDYTGTRKKKKKEGFDRKKDAAAWERDFLEKRTANPSMAFGSMVELYLDDRRQHTKASGAASREVIVNKWILPYFKDKALDQITPADIRAWEADLKNATNSRGDALAPGYMQSIYTALSSIFNYAVRFHGLASNPCTVAGNAIGKKTKSLNFWTQEEFDKFIATFEPTEPYYTGFMVLYYTGMRIGELFALTVSDIDLESNTIHVTKTYHRTNKTSVITTPKTQKSRRDVLIPQFLADCIRDHIARIYAPEPETRLFCLLDGHAYNYQLKKHASIAGVKDIRVHDLRHSHASLLINLGAPALLVSERLGHEKVSTTLDIYSHLFPSKQSEIVKKLEAVYNGK